MERNEFFCVCLTRAEVQRSHRQQHSKYQHAAKVAIVTLLRLIHSEAGTHHSLRFSHNLFLSLSFFSSVFVLVGFTFASITFDCAICNPPSALWGDDDDTVDYRSPKNTTRKRRIYGFATFSVFYVWIFSGKYSCTLSHTIFNGPDRPLHA